MWRQSHGRHHAQVVLAYQPVAQNQDELCCQCGNDRMKFAGNSTGFEHREMHKRVACGVSLGIVRTLLSTSALLMSPSEFCMMRSDRGHDRKRMESHQSGQRFLIGAPEAAWSNLVELRSKNIGCPEAQPPQQTCVERVRILRLFLLPWQSLSVTLAIFGPKPLVAAV